MSEIEFDGPPKPRLTLRVGITGKRVIPRDQRERISVSLSNVFDALAQTLAASHARSAGFVAPNKLPLLRIVSGMAEGADQLAAEAAMARFEQEQREPAGRIVETRLAAILPFAKREYEKDFKKEPRPEGSRDRSDEEFEREVERFEQLLAHPAVESVLEIDDEALLGKTDDIRNQAYANLRDVLLEHTDVLVAVSDDRSGGAGGTVDVIAIAASLNIPVIQISTLTPEVYMMQAAELDAPDRTPRPDREHEIKANAPLPREIGKLIGRIVDPPDSPSPPAGSSGEHESGTRPVRKRLDTFHRDRSKSAISDRMFKAFRDALTVRPEPHERFCSKLFAAFRSTWGSYPGSLKSAEQAAEEMWPPRYNRFSGDGGVQARAILAKRYGWADVLAVRYADATRSAHITIAALGALAVLIALATLVLPQKPDGLALVIKIVALTLEVIVLLLAGRGFFRPAHNERWHERMVEYRAVAELLRHERFIYALGAADRPGRTADRTFEEPDAWVGWYVRATLRELGFPRQVLSEKVRRDVLETFRKEEVDGQISYNKSLSDQFRTIDGRLEKTVRFAFWFTVFVAVIGIVVLGVLGLIVQCATCSHHSAEHTIHGIKPWFTVIAALIPAMIAAIHGIRFQIEFKGTAFRAAATKRELDTVRAELTDELEKASPAPGRKQSVRLVRMANEAMSTDLAGWSNFYRGRGPELG